MDPKQRELASIGWREWLSLPELGIARIKAKVDTGARTSALHAFDLELLERGRRRLARFKIHPIQRSEEGEIEVEAPLVDQRHVRDSGGRAELRPVIRTTVEMMGQRWQIELTLTRRDVMGFRMLLGRQAIRHRFLVDPGSSYHNGRPPRRRKQRGAR